MKIQIIKCLKDNYSYLIIDETNNNACVVDPSEAKPIIDFVENNNINLKYILNTHHHYDHVGGNIELKKKFSSNVIGFNGDKERIPGLDKLLVDNQKFKIGSLNFATLFIPGHTKGHIAFYLKEEKVIFTGDTLFSLGCGRVFEGTNEQMFNSLNRIKSLPENTKIYCGHEYTQKNLEFCIKFNPNNKYLIMKKEDIAEKIKNRKPTLPSTVADEIKTNIFLRYDDLDVKKQLNLMGASDLEIFSKLRDLKDDF